MSWGILGCPGVIRLTPNLPVLIVIAVYTETNRKLLIKILFKKKVWNIIQKIAGSFGNYSILRTF